MMPSEAEQAARKVCSTVSRAFARRCWWADRAELEQQCWQIAMEVWDQRPDGGLDGFSALAYVAMMRQLGRYLRRARHPVSASDHDVQQMSETVRSNHIDKVVVEDRAARVDRVLHVERLRHSIRSRIYALAGRAPAVEASVLVFMDGYAPREAASTLGIDVRDIYAANTVLLAISQSDPEIGRLAADLGQERGWT